MRDVCAQNFEFKIFTSISAVQAAGALIQGETFVYSERAYDRLSRRETCQSRTRLSKHYRDALLGIVSFFLLFERDSCLTSFNVGCGCRGVWPTVARSRTYVLYVIGE